MIDQFEKSNKNLPAGRLLNSRGRNIGPCGLRTHNSTTTAADLIILHLQNHRHRTKVNESHISTDRVLSARVYIYRAQAPQGKSRMAIAINLHIFPFYAGAKTQRGQLLLGCRMAIPVGKWVDFPFYFFFRVGKSLACHSPGKWCLCA